eukprot:gnl/MRDRNA2_/MRDRNA2_134977_c0_seq1.p1 gnl/MRDRNA2_/MRDRNA2_134977_c0~~gnl/MRDRNA2_/MRDRNA2_134977_c0_seq1.p1  ORF type:complete len:296 (+),score=47.93 gnl/MRDRNA2_/MRDRNA2_134977_c0_seq1:92-979(+)
MVSGVGNYTWVLSWILVGLGSALENASNKQVITVLAFGDSMCDIGPTWHAVQDMFNRHGVPAQVRAACKAGTSACHAASWNKGHALVQAARTLFPEFPDGPDYVWYTLGADDLLWSKAYHACSAIATSYHDALFCVQIINKQIGACSENLLDNYFKAFPKSKVMQSGYDIGCESAACLHSDESFIGYYCKSNLTCINSLSYDWQQDYLGALSAKYQAPQYKGLNLIGTVQKAAGIPGADTGKPVLNQGANCGWTVQCVHPMYNSPAGIAFAEAMWDEYFKHQVGAASKDSNLVLV